MLEDLKAYADLRGYKLLMIKWLKLHRSWLLAAIDMLIAGLVYLSYTVITNDGSYYLIDYLVSSVVPMAFYTTALFIFKVYGSLWRYAEAEEFFLCVAGSLVAGFVYAIGYELVIGKIPIINNITASMAVTLALAAYRFAYRIIRKRQKKAPGKEKKRLLIVGAGLAAASLINEIRNNPNSNYLPICAVDDNPEKIGHSINGLKIRGSSEDIPRLCRDLEIETIFICIPSASAEQRRRILDLCAKTTASLKILPEIYAAITDPVRLQKKMRTIRIEDLMGRQENHFDRACIDKFIKDKVVLVTGGGGSIGSELCRQVALSNPKKLIILDICENSVYRVQQEMKSTYNSELDLEVEIASIRDSQKMEYLFDYYKPNIVFHAAAHKHVPLMEHNPEEAFKNNVLGTLNVVNAAQNSKAESFVLISSDKAVNPTNFMGATKRFAEMIVQSRKGVSDTKFVSVRFGNVLGSSGSVVPLFENQIEKGGPVTVTHPDITRFFMTIPEAVQLVLQSSVMAKNGEIFVLDMGEPVRILKLAETMIRLAGLKPYVDIDIVFTGLRPGEKLYEELMMNEEGLESTENSRIFIGHQPHISQDEIESKLNRLIKAVERNDKNYLLRVMQEVVPTYCPDFSEKNRVYGSEQNEIKNEMICQGTNFLENIASRVRDLPE